MKTYSLINRGKKWSPENESKTVYTAMRLDNFRQNIVLQHHVISSKINSIFARLITPLAKQD